MAAWNSLEQSLWGSFFGIASPPWRKITPLVLANTQDSHLLPHYWKLFILPNALSSSNGFSSTWRHRGVYVSDHAKSISRGRREMASLALAHALLAAHLQDCHWAEIAHTRTRNRDLATLSEHSAGEQGSGKQVEGGSPYYSHKGALWKQDCASLDQIS